MRDWFTASFGAAVEDIRAKLIDEGWFGRRTAERAARDDLGWSIDHPRDSVAAHQPNHDHDFDR